MPATKAASARTRSSALGLETASYDEILASNRWVVGSPETVVRKLRDVLGQLRPGILGIWTNDGDTTHADTMRCLELMGQKCCPPCAKSARNWN